ncbi:MULTISPECIES: hypothetical protein [unclassified Microbacterium]|uniref:hypothetical protein n=1 Tax=unclassified Microbacterium TaxID=2609290 RepID=UPI000EA892E3|nr:MULTISPECIES: hypothetical protein [unclassified Microbacterium]MBT2484774.1 hypothetical protein [Microbacterium sp. ISL-108]RKN67650.1 hypothetical protein D7252_08680 [Microbacterium sp. CGR2]
MRDTRTTSVYLILEPHSHTWKPPRVAAMKVRKPALESGQIAVKVNLKIPMAIFDQFIPVLEAEISEPDAILPAIEIEPEVSA